MLGKVRAEEIIKEAMNDRYQGRYSEAMDKFDLVIRELVASDEQWAKLTIGEAMHQIGVALQNVGKDYKAALSCLWCAIAYRQAIRDSIGIAYSYFQIPVCRLASGEKIENVMSDLQRAREAILVAISLAARKDDFRVLGDMNHNLAYISQLQEDYKSAMALYAKALDFREKANDRRGAGLTYARLSECYLKIGEKDGARLNAQEALDIFQEIGDLNRIKQVQKTLAEIGE